MSEMLQARQSEQFKRKEKKEQRGPHWLVRYGFQELLFRLQSIDTSSVSSKIKKEHGELISELDEILSPESRKANTLVKGLALYLTLTIRVHNFEKKAGRADLLLKDDSGVERVRRLRKELAGKILFDEEKTEKALEEGSNDKKRGLREAERSGEGVLQIIEDSVEKSLDQVGKEREQVLNKLRDIFEEKITSISETDDNRDELGRLKSQLSRLDNSFRNNNETFSAIIDDYAGLGVEIEEVVSSGVNAFRQAREAYDNLNEGDRESVIRAITSHVKEYDDYERFKYKYGRLINEKEIERSDVIREMPMAARRGLGLSGEGEEDLESVLKDLSVEEVLRWSQEAGRRSPFMRDYYNPNKMIEYIKDSNSKTKDDVFRRMRQEFNGMFAHVHAPTNEMFEDSWTYEDREQFAQFMKVMTNEEFLSWIDKEGGRWNLERSDVLAWRNYFAGEFKARRMGQNIDAAFMGARMKPQDLEKMGITNDTFDYLMKIDGVPVTANIWEEVLAETILAEGLVPYDLLANLPNGTGAKSVLWVEVERRFKEYLKTLPETEQGYFGDGEVQTAVMMGRAAGFLDFRLVTLITRGQVGNLEKSDGHSGSIEDFGRFPRHFIQKFGIGMVGFNLWSIMLREDKEDITADKIKKMHTSFIDTATIGSDGYVTMNRILAKYRELQSKGMAPDKIEGVIRGWLKDYRDEYVESGAIHNMNNLLHIKSGTTGRRLLTSLSHLGKTKKERFDKIKDVGLWAWYEAAADMYKDDELLEEKRKIFKTAVKANPIFTAFEGGIWDSVLADWLMEYKEQFGLSFGIHDDTNSFMRRILISNEFYEQKGREERLRIVNEVKGDIERVRRFVQKDRNGIEGSCRTELFEKDFYEIEDDDWNDERRKRAWRMVQLIRQEAESEGTVEMLANRNNNYELMANDMKWDRVSMAATGHIDLQRAVARDNKHAYDAMYGLGNLLTNLPNLRTPEDILKAYAEIWNQIQSYDGFNAPKFTELFLDGVARFYKSNTATRSQKAVDFLPQPFYYFFNETLKMKLSLAEELVSESMPNWGANDIRNLVSKAEGLGFLNANNLHGDDAEKKEEIVERLLKKYDADTWTKLLQHNLKRLWFLGFGVVAMFMLKEVFDDIQKDLDSSVKG